MDLRGRGRRLGFWVMLALGAGLPIAAGCIDPNASGTASNQDIQSFGSGYEDGKRDGLNSWSDMHAGWTWLWTKSEQYRQDYNRGWADGRNLRKLKEQRKEMGQ